VMLDERHALLRALHPTDYRDLRAFRNGESVKTCSLPAHDLAGVDQFAEQHRDRNVYVGVAPRVANGRNTAACSALHSVFADLDFKDSSESAARERLSAFPVEPSVIVASGGGLQAYWFLRELMILRGDGAASAKRLLQALATAVGGDLSAAEPARI